MTVADILRDHGKWIESKDFLKLVMKKLDKKESQAYRDIRKAIKTKSIVKEGLPDRRVLYGLPEFGPYQIIKDTVSRTELRKELKEISNLAIISPKYALRKLGYFIIELPDSILTKKNGASLLSTLKDESQDLEETVMRSIFELSKILRQNSQSSGHTDA